MSIDDALLDDIERVAGLLGGTFTPVRVQRWVAMNGLAIEPHDSHEDAPLLNVNTIRLAENTNDDIDAAELLDTLRTDLLVQKALLAPSSAAYGM